ncbi:MAG: hypothetical protein ACOC8L_01365 [Spirochaetota bacterium]
MSRRSFASVFLIILPATFFGQHYFVSDPLGLRGPSISSDERDAYEWVLEVSQADREVTELLYRDETLVERRRRVSDSSGATVEVFTDGTLARVERTSLSGNLLWEERYRSGELVERRVYEYRDDILQSRQVLAADGSLLTTERYGYWRDGSLRVVERTDPRSTSILTYVRGRLSRATRRDGVEEETIEYDELGRVSRRRVWEGDELVVLEEREYWAPDPDASVQRIVIDEAGTRRVERYDQEGSLIASEEGTGTTVERSRQRIFEDGVLVEERELIDGVARVTSYLYHDSGALDRKRVTEDGALVLEVEYPLQGTATRVETIYRDGEPLLQVLYAGETRIRELIYQSGEVVRTREFGTPDAEEEPEEVQ